MFSHKIIVDIWTKFKGEQTPRFNRYTVTFQYRWARAFGLGIRGFSRVHTEAAHSFVALSNSMTLLCGLENAIRAQMSREAVTLCMFSFKQTRKQSGPDCRGLKNWSIQCTYDLRLTHPIISLRHQASFSKGKCPSNPVTSPHGLGIQKTSVE